MAVPAIHPGEHLTEELKELNMSAAALARRLKAPTNRVAEILNGRRAVAGDTALRLAYFSVPVRNLAQPAKALRATPCREESRQDDQGPADPQERTRPRLSVTEAQRCRPRKGLSPSGAPQMPVPAG